jgi:hypothetical protein
VWKSPFLDERASKRFSSLYDSFRRRVVRRPSNGEKPSDPQDLEEFVEQELRSVAHRSRGSGRALRILGLSIRENDGLSWSASAAFRALERSAGTLKHTSKPTVKPLRGELAIGGLPEIADLVQPRRFGRLAQKHKATTSLPQLNPWFVVAVVVGAVLLGAAASLATALMKSAAPSEVTPADLFRPGYLGLALLAAVVALAAKQLGGRLGKPFDEAAMRGLATDLKERRERRAESYQAFVEALARWLAENLLPRCVVVHDYAELDVITQDVLYTYFSKYAKAASNWELWVIFETTEVELFHKLVSRSREEPWYRATVRYEQLLLDSDERQRLADRCDKRDGTDFDRAKDICEGAGDGKELDAFFQAHRQRQPASETKYGSLELFYLLGLGAASSGSPRYGTESLVDDYDLSRKRVIRADVLSQFLQGSTLNKDELETNLQRLKEHFTRYLEVDEAQGEFRVSTAPARYLAEHHGQYGLPDPRLGQLFWALWISDIGETAQGFWVRKLATHLLEVGSPDAIPVRQPLSAAVTTAFFNTTVFAIDACIKACLLEFVPKLLKMGLALAESGPANELERRRSRLLTRSWQAYGILGDEQILSGILGLRSQQASDASTTSPPSDPLDQLFLESVSLLAKEIQPRREELTAPWRESTPTVRSYGQLRAYWLAVSLGGFLGGVEPLLDKANSVSTDRLLQLVGDAIERLRDAKQRVAIDAMAVSVGLWSLTMGMSREFAQLKGLRQQLGRLRRSHELVRQVHDRHDAHMTQASELLDLLVGTYDVARDGLKDARIAPGYAGAADFVLDVLASELLVVGSACAAILLRTYGEEPESSFSHDLALEVLYEGGLPELSDQQSRTAVHPSAVSRELSDKIEARLELLRVAWSGLGLRELGSIANMRRGQLHVILGGSAVQVDAIDLLANETKAASFVGVLSNFVVAQGVAGEGEMRSTYIWHGVSAALDAGFGRTLSRELCLVALGAGHSFGMNLDPLLDYLVEDRRRGVRIPVLNTLDDQQVVQVTLWLLNSLSASDRPDLATRVLEALRARVVSMEEENLKDTVNQIMELFELDIELKENTNVNVEEFAKKWRSQGRDGGHFAWLLYLGLRADRGRGSKEMISQATRVLREHRDNVDHSSYIHLATHLADRLADRLAPDSQQQRQDRQGREAVTAAVALLKGIMPRWEARLRVESNIDIYRILRDNDKPDAANHVSALKRLEVVRLERDRVVGLPTMIEEGQFFMVFRHYYAVLVKWGLEADRPVKEVLPIFDHDAGEARKRVKEWQDRDEGVPDPFVRRSGRALLSSSFLLVGTDLFSPPFDKNEAFAQDRADFNDKAKYGLRTLYEEVARLDSIPIEIRGVLQRHRQSLLDPTPPMSRSGH